MLLTLLILLSIIYFLHWLGVRLLAAVLLILVLSVSTGCMKVKQTMEAQPHEYSNATWTEMRPL